MLKSVRVPLDLIAVSQMQRASIREAGAPLYLPAFTNQILQAEARSAEGDQVGVVPTEARPQADAGAPDFQALQGQPLRGWRKRLGVEPSLPSGSAATGFEDREGHRAPFASAHDCIRGHTSGQTSARRVLGGRGPGLTTEAGRDGPRRQFSIRRTSAARGPFADSSVTNSTR